jgi:hypothetical protein
LKAGDVSEATGQCESRLKEFRLRDMRTFEGNGPQQLDRLFTVYPRLIASVMEQVYRSDAIRNHRSDGSPGMRSGVMTVRQLISDLIRGGPAMIVDVFMTS